MNRHQTFLLLLGAATLGFGLGALTDRPPAGLKASDMDSTIASSKPSGVTPKGAGDDNPLTAILGALGEQDRLKQFAILGTWLNRLDTAQMHEFLEHLNHLRPSDRERLIPAVVSRWTARDPAAATEWMQPYLTKYLKEPWHISGFANFDTNLVNAWAKGAPSSALEFARQNSETRLGGMILHNAIFAMRGPDAEKYELVRTFPPGRERQKFMASFFSSWAQDDQDAALAAAKALQGREREGALTRVLQTIAYSRPTMALAEADAAGLQDPALLAILVREAAKGDPAVAARWLDARSPELSAELAVALMTGWVEKDPAAALTWARQHRLSPTDRSTPDIARVSEEFGEHFGFEFFGGDQFSSALQFKPEATIAWLRDLPAGEERDRYIEAAVRSAPKIAPFVSFLSQMSGEAATRVAGRIGAKLVYEDPVGAEQWAGSLPPGPVRSAAWEGIGRGRTEPIPLPPGSDRDAMLAGMATIMLENEPHKAPERALEISDPSLRRRAFEDAIALWVQDGSEAKTKAARTWLETAPVPGDWKRSVLETILP